jgi:hypothetical protein
MRAERESLANSKTVWRRPIGFPRRKTQGDIKRDHQRNDLAVASRSARIRVIST